MILNRIYVIGQRWVLQLKVLPYSFGNWPRGVVAPEHVTGKPLQRGVLGNEPQVPMVPRMKRTEWHILQGIKVIDARFILLKQTHLFGGYLLRAVIVRFVSSCRPFLVLDRKPLVYTVGSLVPPQCDRQLSSRLGTQQTSPYVLRSLRNPSIPASIARVCRAHMWNPNRCNRSQPRRLRGIFQVVQSGGSHLWVIKWE